PPRRGSREAPRERRRRARQAAPPRPPRGGPPGVRRPSRFPQPQASVLVDLGDEGLAAVAAEDVVAVAEGIADRVVGAAGRTLELGELPGGAPRDLGVVVVIARVQVLSAAARRDHGGETTATPAERIATLRKRK